MMYQGKHTNKAVNNGTPRRKRRLRWNKQFVLLVSILALVIGVIGGSLAYLFTNTDSVQNTFTPGTVNVDIDESFNKTVKENVHFTNSGNVDVYVRAKVIENWTDSEGNFVTNVPEGYSSSTDLSTVSVKNGWVYQNGYYYYTAKVPAGGSTANLLDVYQPVYADTITTPEYFLNVDILVEAIQADGKTENGTLAVVDAWGVNPESLKG